MTDYANMSRAELVAAINKAGKPIFYERGGKYWKAYLIITHDPSGDEMVTLCQDRRPHPNQKETNR